MVADTTVSPPVLRLAGDLDLATGDLLDDAFSGLPGEPSTVVLDLRNLAFLDSAGLTAIVRLNRRLSSRGGKTVLRSPRPFVREILRLAGLDRILEVTGGDGTGGEDEPHPS